MAATLCKDRTARSNPMSLRIRPEPLELIDEAAAYLHEDRTTFMVQAAVARAHDVLRDRAVFRLSDEDHARFIAALDNPPPPNQRLRELVHRTPLWERERD